MDRDRIVRIAEKQIRKVLAIKEPGMWCKPYVAFKTMFKGAGGQLAGVDQDWAFLLHLNMAVKYLFFFSFLLLLITFF